MSKLTCEDVGCPCIDTPAQPPASLDVAAQVRESLCHPVGDDSLVTHPIALEVLAYVKRVIDTDLSRIAEVDRLRAELATRPTTHAYEAACKALWKHRDRADRYWTALNRIADYVAGLPPSNSDARWIHGIAAAALEVGK